MNKRRAVAAVVALVLAGVGSLVLVTYVKAADRRAMAGMNTVSVLVVKTPIAARTAADALGTQVSTKVLPITAVASGTLSSLSQVSGRVTTTDMQAGEQLLASRFADPASLSNPGEVKVPPGLQQISVVLDAQRVLGGSLTSGASVGIFISLPKDDPRPAQTHEVLDKVLVTKVDGGTTAADGGKAAAAAKSSGAGVTVTFAVNARDAEKIVYGAEFGTVWLSLESVDSTVSGSRVVTAANVYTK